jgi:hypothetical protein
MESMPAINLNTAKKADTQVKASLKAAGSLVTKKAERTKLVTVTLPRAYWDLGKAVHKQGLLREVFADLFEEVDSLQADHRKSSVRNGSRPAPETLADKARRVASEAAELAKSKSTDLQLVRAFAALGEKAYRQYGTDAGPSPLVETIAAAAARRDTLDREMNAINATAKGQWITPKRVAWGLGILLAMAVLGNLTEERSGSRRTSRSDNSTSTSGHTGSGNDKNKSLVGCPRGKSEKYKTGWSSAVVVAQTFDRERKQMRASVDKIPNGTVKQANEEILESGTEKRRMQLMEKLWKAKENLKYYKKGDPNSDLIQGQVEGYEYALRNILQEHY